MTEQWQNNDITITNQWHNKMSTTMAETMTETITIIMIENTKQTSLETHHHHFWKVIRFIWEGGDNDYMNVNVSGFVRYAVSLP